MSDIESQKANKEIIVVIFSKDRAVQLDACLKWFSLHCKDVRGGSLLLHLLARACTKYPIIIMEVTVHFGIVIFAQSST